MFNRPLRTNGIGNSFVDSLSWGRSVVPQYPPYGTYISSACGTYNGLGQYDTVNDALGTQWNVSIEVWNQLADGSGGSFWTDAYMANVSPCFYPYGYVHTGYVNDTFHWYAQNGENGDFNWGEAWNVDYYDGNGGSLHEEGVYNAYDYGYVIWNGDAAGHVVNLQNGNWAFWFGYGYYLGTGSSTIDYVTNCGSWSYGSYTYGIYADGSGGTYYSNGSGGWYAAGWLGYCDGYDYYHDGQGNVSSVYNYNPPYGTVLNEWDTPHYEDYGYGNWYVGTEHWHTFADGTGGTFDNYSVEYLPYGTLIGQSEFEDFYSSGTEGGHYTQSGGWHQPDPECPSYGTVLIPEQSGQYTISTNCGDFVIGNWYDDADYADGSCGYYNDNSSYYNYYEYGTYVGSCNGENYYSDGSGGSYTEPNGNGGGNDCEDPNMYAGQEGWNYDGCHWSYSDPNPPPPDYPPYGTSLSSSSSDIGSNIEWSGYNNGDFLSGVQPVSLGYSYENIFADGNGGSFGESGTSWTYDWPTDVFEAPYGTEISLEWATETPIGTFSGTTKYADDVNVWKASGGSTYMDRLYRRPSIFDGTVIFETPSWDNEGSQWKTQIILQGGGFITNTLSF